MPVRAHLNEEQLGLAEQAAAVVCAEHTKQQLELHRRVLRIEDAVLPVREQAEREHVALTMQLLAPGSRVCSQVPQCIYLITRDCSFGLKEYIDSIDSRTVLVRKKSLQTLGEQFNC